MSLSDALLLDPAPLNVWLACRTDGIKGSGTASDPWNASTATEFDEILRNKVAVNTRVHLGPGTYQTKGYHDGAATDYGWQAKEGVTIVGSGIDVSILKIAEGSGVQHFAVGHILNRKVDCFEISDLTIDCNLPNVPMFDIRGAVRLMGDHVKIHRVKAINWGSQTGYCVVFSLVTASPLGEFPLEDLQEVANAGMEGCIAVQPSINAGVVTVFHVGGVEGHSFSREYHGKSPYIRNCFVDCGVSAQGHPGIFRGISMAWCRGGVVEGNTVLNTDVAGPYQDTRSIMDVIVRNNYFKNVAQGIALSLGQVGAELNTSAASLFAASGLATISGGGLVASGLLKGDRVSIASIPEFTGVHQIRTIDYAIPSISFQTAETTISPVSVTFVKKVAYANRVIIEGNEIELTPESSDPSAVSIEDNQVGTTLVEPPDYVFGDIVIRNNKIRYLDGVTPDDVASTLIAVQGARRLIVKGNTLDTVSETPLEYERCAHATFYDNRTMAGALLTQTEAAPRDFHDSLEMPAEDALAMSCFHKS